MPAVSERAPDPIAIDVKKALESGDEHAAVTRALEGYGPEVMGFLVAFLRDSDAADDVFSQFCEDVWHGLSRFRWEGALRAWVYAVARHAAVRYRRTGYERRRRPLEAAAALSQLEERVRTLTVTYLRTENRSAIDRLREQLAPDERALLILRLDRKLAWNEIAEIMADEEPKPTPESLKKDAATLRKRFERVKDRLRELAKAAGLLGDG
jgi:RNA polymerase sigma-70 factor (ECF subfamily)